MAFEVQLGDVMLADAIRDPDLRALLSDAERALNAEDATKAFLITDQAFLKARERWREQHGEARREDSGVGANSAVLHPATPSEPLDHLEVQVFATDMSRYTQLLTTRRQLQIGGPEPDGRRPDPLYCLCSTGFSAGRYLTMATQPSAIRNTGKA